MSYDVSLSALMLILNYLRSMHHQMSIAEATAAAKDLYASLRRNACHLFHLNS
jgi:hypothetical protein